MTNHNTAPETEFSDKEEKVIKSIKSNRIIIPIVLGLGVAAWLLYRKWDAEAIASIPWDTHTFTWIGIAAGLMVVRHLAFSFRLRLLSDNFFSWKKAITLFLIWEFSSSVSPTTVGGAAVALFILSQENYGAAKTAALVIYTIVLDTFFFVTFIPTMVLIFGQDVIPLVGRGESGQWIFYLTFSVMIAYGGFFFYGLFFSPSKFKAIVKGVTKIKFLRRFQDRAEELGNDIIKASNEIRGRKFSFHLKGYLATCLAWSLRFIILSCLVIAFNPAGKIPLEFVYQTELYAKIQSLFVILLLLPSPGGAGFAEFIFDGFLVSSGYIRDGVSSIVALIWRLITYYPYLIFGAIVIPVWLRNRINDRRKEKSAG